MEWGSGACHPLTADPQPHRQCSLRWRRIVLILPPTAMSEAPQIEDVNQLRDERDLYLQLLNLGRQTELLQFLQQALVLVVGVTRAQQCYLALFDDDDSADAPRWWSAH